MLNIYYGGENIEKEKFIFEHIKRQISAACTGSIFPAGRKRRLFLS